MAFQYKLETLLKLRRNKEEVAQQNLAREIGTLEQHKQVLDQLRQSRLEFIDLLEEKKKTALPAPLYQFYIDSVENQDRQIRFQVNTIKAQEQIIISSRAVLEEKTQARKIVERMKEKAYVEYVDEIVRQEQKELDELSVLRFKR